jgi:hypothetical protein
VLETATVGITIAIPHHGNALAIKSEPYIFWRGDGASEIITEVNNKLPKNSGEFVLPDKKFKRATGTILTTKKN